MRYFLIIGIVVLSFAFQDGRQKYIRQMGTLSINEKPVSIKPLIIDFQDTIKGDTLFMQLTNDGLPHSYFRKVKTGVCIDGECRLLDIVIHWNPTGRYLGFELPTGEFLSKTEHEAFSPEEYQLLHQLLSDRFSLLAGYTIDELTPAKDSVYKDVDAVSSATLQDILDHVVPGAVYTTYTLWHIVYGNSQKEVENQTRQVLNEKLALRILESESVDDQIWILKNISGKTEITPTIQDKIIGLISNENFYLSETAISTLDKKLLENTELQNKLFSQFANSNYSIKRIILKKLREAPRLSLDIQFKLFSGIESYNGSLVKSTLELLQAHKIDDLQSCLKISELLDHDNKFIARKAFQYLNSVKITDKKIERRMKRFSN